MPNKTFILVFALSAIIMVAWISCTDSNVRGSRAKGPNKIFEVVNEDGTVSYIKRVSIDGDKIYFIVNKNGEPVAGASSNQPKGKGRVNIASIVDESF